MCKSCEAREVPYHEIVNGLLQSQQLQKWRVLGDESAIDRAMTHNAEVARCRRGNYDISLERIGAFRETVGVLLCGDDGRSLVAINGRG